MIHVRFAASLAALALLLVGCSDDDPKPAPAPSPSAPVSTSATPTPEPSSTAAAPSPVETVKAWVAARNQTLKDGGTEEVYALSTPGCKTCRDLVEPFAQHYADGGTIKTKGWEVDNATEAPGFKKHHQVLAALTFTRGLTTLPGEGSSSFPEEKHILQFQLEQSPRGWLVAQVIFLP